MNEVWLDVSEVAQLADIAKQNVRKAAAGKLWFGVKLITRHVKGNTGTPRRQILLTSLPQDLQARYLQQQVEQAEIKSKLPIPLSALEEPAPQQEPELAKLKGWQRKVMEARLSLVRRVQLHALGNGGSLTRAVQAVIADAKAGKLPPELQRALVQASAKKHQEIPSERTLYRWVKGAMSGTDAAAIAPRVQVKADACPAWAAKFLKLYQRPTKPSIWDAWEALKTVVTDNPPSYQQCKRLLGRMGTVEKHRGRMGSRELKTLRGYVARDVSDLWPGDIYIGDGHTFDAEVAHPDHGRPFRPEITTILDVYTRKAVGWSAGLSESTWSVMDALRNAVETNGVPAIWYTDRGSGFEADAHTNPITGFLARLGITRERALPYASQSRGVIERAHQTIWVSAARQLPTYMGDDMDKQARDKAFKQTRKDLKEKGTSKLLLPWRDFLVFVQSAIDDYNSRPHSSLPRITEPATGQTRHQTPNEAWALATHEGFQPVMLSPPELRDLFRPHKRVKVSRCVVTLWNNHYYHDDLEPYHGEFVLVGYDIHDAGQVWVRDLEERLVCVAKWDGNKKAYFPKSAVEQAREKREAGRLKRLEAKADEIRAEGHPGNVIELRPLTEDERQTARQELQKLEALQAPAAADDTHIYIRSESEVLEGDSPPELAPDNDGRPIFRSDIEYWRWIQDNPALATPDDYDYLDQRIAESSAFRFQVEVDLETRKKNQLSR